MNRRRKTDLENAYSLSLVGQIVRHMATAAGVAAIAATLFTAWKPASLSPGELAAQLLASVSRQSQEEIIEPLEGAQTGTLLPVGVVAGHSGPNPQTGLADPGAVCSDGLTELEVNQTIADLVVQGLQASGLEVVLFEEFDDRLMGFRGVALVSIHADSCMWINDQATGYKVTAALDATVPDRTQRLVTCVVDRYGKATDLKFHPGSITRDMTEYHTFKEIHTQTPAVIIETGFLYLDREFLTERPEVAASGIVDGVLCYLNNEPAQLPLEDEP